jgi:hypothetical protein
MPADGTLEAVRGNPPPGARRAGEVEIAVRRRGLQFQGHPTGLHLVPAAGAVLGGNARGGVRVGRE